MGARRGLTRRGALLKRARAAALRAGIDISWASPASSVAALRRRILADRNIDLLVDGGANVGQYGSEARAQGYAARLLSYEPIASAFAELEARASGDPLWDCRRAALSDAAGQLDLNVAVNRVSSSLLPIGERHVEAAADSRTERSESVATVRLDDDAGAEIAAASAPYLKLDVQGAELMALAGAASSLERVVAIEAELSLVELYEGAPRLPDMFAHLEPLGFVCVGVFPAFTDRAGGRVLQADGVFERPA